MKTFDPSTRRAVDSLQRWPRVLLYSHDGLGLGHLRRTLAIAGELATARPDATLLATVGSGLAQAFELPANFDYVKLPEIGKRHLFERTSTVDADPRAPEDIYAIREAILAATAQTFAPHLVLVDHEPGGYAGELIPALTQLRRATPRPRLVLGLRDITFGPDETYELWESSGVYDLLDSVYDQILVYGCREIFDPVREYRFSPRAAAKTSFTGYVRSLGQVGSSQTLRKDLETDTRPLVIVTAGGGSDGAPLVRAYLTAVRENWLPGVVSYVVTGPQMLANDHAEVRGLAAGSSGVTVVPFSDNLMSLIQAADAVVTMGGYNSVVEAVSLGKRPIVVPRARMSEEQVIRAERFAERGLLTMLHPADLTPGGLARMVTAELARSMSPPAVLDFDGARRAVQILMSTLAS